MTTLCDRNGGQNELAVRLARAMARIEFLEAENDLLRSKNVTLQELLGLDRRATVQVAFGLTETLASLLILLADGKPRNKERLHSALYANRHDDVPAIKVMDKLVCHLRRAVEPFGVRIATVWGQGYRMSAGDDVVRHVMTPQ